jgi:hypothetical protein
MIVIQFVPLALSICQTLRTMTEPSYGTWKLATLSFATDTASLRLCGLHICSSSWQPACDHCECMNERTISAAAYFATN